MQNQALLDELRGELLRRRLPRYYVHRVLREMSDHCADIAAEHRDGGAADSLRAAARIGDPRQLAQRFAGEFRARHFAGRHPWLVFLLAPIPCTIALGAAWFTALFSLLDACGALNATASSSWYAQSAATILHQMGVWLPLLMVTAWLGRCAYRSGCGQRWVWTVGALQCLFAAAFQSRFTLPTAPGNGSFVIGLSWPPVANPAMLLPFAVTVLLALRHRGRASGVRPALPV